MGFPLELKTKVIEAADKGKMTYADIAKKFGVSISSVTAWRNAKYKTKGKKAATKKTVAKKSKKASARMAKAH